MNLKFQSNCVKKKLFLLFLKDNNDTVSNSSQSHKDFVKEKEKKLCEIHSIEGCSGISLESDHGIIIFCLFLEDNTELDASRISNDKVTKQMGYKLIKKLETLEELDACIRNEFCPSFVKQNNLVNCTLCVSLSKHNMRQIYRKCKCKNPNCTLRYFLCLSM